ncbi:MAG: 50S ribosomal protein L15 [Bacteriovorax sp.]|nr:50S ribosomal protein L15 [Bacteriovorax sp.]
MLTLTNLQSPKGANKNTKRLGRGQASGQGTQAGKGHKGQKARKSGHVRSGFEGNNLPLYMRLPKRGFNNTRFAEAYAVVTLENIELKFNKSETVNRETLIVKGLLSGADKRLKIKVIGCIPLTKSLNFEEVNKFSKKALESIKNSSGTVK